jgi:ATPase family associated with various cellular activities (AAA)/Winged helix domain, variant
VNAAATHAWLEANQNSLSAALDDLAQRLEGGPQQPPARGGAESGLPAPPALESLCAGFGLSGFERDVVLLCAGVELDSSFAARCAAAHDDPRRGFPTFSLALARLPGAHWSALVPAAPLRHWRLIEIGAGETLTTSPLRIDERVLHYLTGVQHLDERLLGLIEPVPRTELPPSHEALARRLATAVRRLDPPVVQLCGCDAAASRAVAAAAAGELGLWLHALRARDLPGRVDERAVLARLWERDAFLGSSGLLVEWEGDDGVDAARAAVAFIEQTAGLALLAGPESLRPGRRPILRLDVSRPRALEQEQLWRAVLGEAGEQLNGQVAQVVEQFDLGPDSIRAAGADALSRATEALALWDVCRVQARPRLDDLAQRIEPRARWDDLVLPDAERQILREITLHVRYRMRVHEGWGFAARSTRGLGISALFTGPSGTGKTMAAEVLARELRLDLYRIDLSQVVSKYIGETEKNLRRIFDAAEDGGVILLFDEADALFGKRTEVRDSHDRYANIEISFLLQRMEEYRGLAILTTNMKSALDAAFLRRLRFVVRFPFPEEAERTEIWRRIFPAETPVEGLEVEKLARLGVAGGTIRNIALAAAFLAADAGEPVRMEHLQRATRAELAKLERPIVESELGGWA